MSYRLIDSNAIAITYPEVNEMPCVFADLPDGLNGQFIYAQPDLARDIATILENEKDMRVILKNAQQGRWIPVTERLPEEDYETGNGVQFSTDVLVTIVNHENDGELFVWLLKMVDGKWYDYISNDDGTHELPYWCEVVAWMPLPEPYKE